MIRNLISFVVWLALAAFVAEPTLAVTGSPFDVQQWWLKTPTVTNIGGFCANDTGNATTYTSNDVFTLPAAGTSSGRRFIVVVFGGEDGTTDFSASSATLNAAAMTELGESANAGSLVQTAIYGIHLSPGTTGTIDVAITWSEAITANSYCVYEVRDLRCVPSVAASCVFDTTSAFDTASASMTLSTDIKGYGVAIGGAASGNSGAITTWTGLTENVDGNSAEHSLTVASIGAQTTGDQTPLAITADYSGTDDSVGTVVSLW